MSSMLDQAIVDAQALREAALKNAEQSVIEKYAPEIKAAVESLLEGDDKQEVIKEEVIKLNRNKISALDYFFNAKNELVIAGFYSSQIRYNYEGYFLFKYDDNLTLVHKNQYHFNEKIIKTFISSSVYFIQPLLK